MRGARNFILTEACSLLPQVRSLLVRIREARSNLVHVVRRLERFDNSAEEETSLRSRKGQAMERLQHALREAERLGVEITPGIRCEALFPFEHRWIGPYGDRKIRPAYFAYSDSQETIVEWFFSGWPKDRRNVAVAWREVYRATN